MTVSSTKSVWENSLKSIMKTLAFSQGETIVSNSNQSFFLFQSFILSIFLSRYYYYYHYFCYFSCSHYRSLLLKTLVWLLLLLVVVFSHFLNFSSFTTCLIFSLNVLICYYFLFSLLCYHSLNKKWSFPLRISSVNEIKSAGTCGFGHIYWRNP